MARLGMGLCLLLAACAIQGRQQHGPDLAAAGGWQWRTIPAGPFELAAATRPARVSVADTAPLVIYIEGDGFAYRSATQPAQDPTPVDPVALRLALAHPGDGPAAWLARPCQYTAVRRPCDPAYWTDARWAPEVVDSTGMALDQLKRDAGAGRLVLVGYSGGGALAALLAERRDDVVALVTVAANLDLDSWVRAHDLAPLTRSLNPAAAAAALAALPQIHISGGRDTTVGRDILRAFTDRLPPSAPVRVLDIPDQDHGGGWATIWPELSRRAEFKSLPGWLPPSGG
ncbi:alpha/beta hydrolase [Niveispirillum sp.]|uniref:alpha/beta hydrolase n=1 Tax=Niveispirillum sp. TaxID=1917217 RepID=UPI001B465E0A|nr:alpha/beta hydrolase [Niveispirillum sp.]MBP7340588.1 alpha/beta hydrolase [Niveispirillum sp.]